jgi:high-affinity Fe2+/Pb2+ permease
MGMIVTGFKLGLGLALAALVLWLLSCVLEALASQHLANSAIRAQQRAAAPPKSRTARILDTIALAAVTFIGAVMVGTALFGHGPT